MKKKDWLKLKKYTHFSPPYESKDKGFIRSYVANPAKVKAHKFHPFIHYTINANRYKRGYDDTGIRDLERTLKSKKRQIFYADHLDAQIYAYYNFLINELLDKEYNQENNKALNNSVIAYRSIPLNKNRNKCNIDFAKEVFDFIANSDKLELSTVCFDVKSFFDTLDHKILKQAWYNLLNKKNKNLPEDHYAIFKAITQFSFVEIGDLISEFNELGIKKLIYLKKKGVKSFCKSGKEFRERVVNNGLIHFNKFDFKTNKKRTYGIPQGSPISATLSNLYLLELDKILCEKAKSMGGMYRRYSDDILFICPPSEVNSIKKFLIKSILDDYNLIIQEAKTQEVTFERNDVSEEWSCYMIENSVKKYGKPLSYLGFDFDGKQILVRPKSLSQFYRKLKRLIRRGAHYALSSKISNENPYSKCKKIKDAWIYRERIYKSKSHLGSKKKKIDGKVFWGNYISYMYTASKVMNAPSIRKQVRNHWRIIEREIKKFEDLYELQKTPSKRSKKP